MVFTPDVLIQNIVVSPVSRAKNPNPFKPYLRPDPRSHAILVVFSAPPPGVAPGCVDCPALVPGYPGVV